MGCLPSRPQVEARQVVAQQNTFRLRADDIDENGKVLPTLSQGYTKMVVEVDEEMAKRIKSLVLRENPVTEIEGVEKLGAVETVWWWWNNKGESLPRWMEALPMKLVHVVEGSIKELPAWLFSIPTIEEIEALSNYSLETVDFGFNPSATLTKLKLELCNIKSLPDDLFAHGLEEVDLSRNNGKEKTGR